MLQLLTCVRGHFWESVDAGSSCPECGAPAESLPMLELVATTEPPPIRPPDDPPLELDGQPVVPGYRIIKELPPGPTGVRRFRARQALIDRQVLLEVVLARDDATQRAWSSLRSEAGLLGKLQHPHIVAILDAGERGRELFFNTLEWVEGPTLAEATEDQLLPLDQALALVEILARTVDHAHRQKVYHRHLEPATVLLQKFTAEGDGSRMSDSFACRLFDESVRPMLTGFGLARRPIEGDPSDASLYVDPGYLSPEQAWGRSRDMGVSTDVYGLGAILFYLLTGRPPFHGSTLGDLLDAIQTAPLVSPAAIRRIPADLEWVCRKALARPLKQRYSTAAAFADDLRAVAQGLPPREGVGGRRRRVLRWVRRRPLVTALLASNLLLLGYGCIVGGSGRGGRSSSARTPQVSALELQAARQRIQSLEAQVASLQAAQRFPEYRLTLERAVQAVQAGKLIQARLLLEKCSPEERGFEWYFHMERTSKRERFVLPAGDGVVRTLAFHPRDPHRAAVVHVNQQSKPFLQIWDLTQRRGTVPLEVPLASVEAIGYSPGGDALALIGGVPNGSLLLYHWQGRSARPALVRSQVLSPDRLSTLDWNPRLNALAVATARGRILQLDPSAGRVIGRPLGLDLPGSRTQVQFSPDGVYLAAFSSDDAEVRIWLQSLGRFHLSIPGPGQVVAMAVGPNPLLAVARSDDSIHFHTIDHGQEIMKIDNVGSSIVSLAFDPEGKRLAVACRNDTVKLFARTASTWEEVLEISTPSVQAVRFNSTGRTLAILAANETTLYGAVGN